MIAAMNLTRVDVSYLVDRRRVGRFHFALVGLSALAMAIAGFDTDALGYVMPALSRSFGLTPETLAPVFAADALGGLAGLLAGAPLADRIGRRPVILGAMLLFALCNFATIGASTVPELVGVRFVAGLGLGAMAPAALALAAEFIPRGHRVAMTVLVWLGFVAGAGAAAPVTAYVLGNMGWPILFLFAGLMPVIAAPVLWAALPESLFVMTRRGEAAMPLIRLSLMRISRRYDFLRTTAFYSSEPDERGFQPPLLFRAGRAPITALLWGVMLTGLAAAALLDAELARVLGDAGFDDSWAPTIGAFAELAGMIGAFVLALAADRLNRFAVLAGGFGLGALAIAAFALADEATLPVAAASPVAEFLAVGSAGVAVAVAAASYPSAMGATGIGWALAAGRIGQIAATAIDGALPALDWRASNGLYLAAILAIGAAACAALIAWSRRRFAPMRDDSAAAASRSPL
jgi:MFS transporter, AAHS family, 4-hydroxybenzoate transporter